LLITGELDGFLWYSLSAITLGSLNEQDTERTSRLLYSATTTAFPENTARRVSCQHQTDSGMYESGV
jgi:hypothetical protein